jgi:hypothetical protein
MSELRLCDPASTVLAAGEQMSDTAELITRLRNDGSSWAQDLFNEAAAALEVQAQEIKRLKGNPGRKILNHKWLDYFCVEEGCQSLVLKQRAEAAEARVRELETINKRTGDMLDGALAMVKTERDAIEAATIERCAAIVGDHRVAARIRALGPS